MKLTRPLGGIAVLCAVLACGAEAQQKADAPRANVDALVLEDFKKRVDAYVKLRNKLKGDAPAMKETADPAKIKASQDALAAKMREARKDAKPGEIFAPEIRAKFRELMYPELKGAEGKATKATIKEDAPATAVDQELGRLGRDGVVRGQRHVPRITTAADDAAEPAREPAEAARGSRIPHHRQASDSPRRSREHHRRLHPQRDSVMEVI